MPDALIGWSGVVGGTLQRQRHFDDRFRSTDIDDIRGRDYDLIVCAGMPAEKWRANREPEQDAATLERLWGALREARARHVIVISTVDVFGDPRGVDEATQVDPGVATPYGRHRFELEERVRGAFDATIVRLPALFGLGMRKNIVYDLLHENMVDAICPRSVFQFYPLDRLWGDLGVVLHAGLPLVHLTVEGTSVGEVAREAFGRELADRPELRAVEYDLRTRYAAQFGARGHYLLTREGVLAALRGFVAARRGAQ
jgi:NAD dependent epimerase/dehydratase family